MTKYLIFIILNIPIILNAHIAYTTSMQRRAERGDAKAQYNLGVSYYYGYGIEVDYYQSYLWLLSASDSFRNDKQYKIIMKSVENMLSQEQRQLAREETDTIKKKATKILREHNQRSYIMIGYAANFPEQQIGVRLARVSPQQVGVFFDIKLTVPTITDRNDFYDNISINRAENIFQDELISNHYTWTSINGGVTFYLSKGLSFYGGVGISLYSYYLQYYDSFEILGRYGKYWIEDKDKSSWKLNMLGGLLILPDQNSKVNLQLGAELNPAGLGLGLGWAF